MTHVPEYALVETAAGCLAIAWRGDVVTSVRLPASREAAARSAVLKRFPDAQATIPPPAIAALIEAIQSYFRGERIDFSAVPVDLGEQTPFFEAVYARVRALGYGETTTYGAVAKALGAGPQAAQDVGRAMASNPVPLIVPCHRVLAAGGKIGGFSAPGGSESKALMLKLEGVEVAEPVKPKPKSVSTQGAFDF